MWDELMLRVFVHSTEFEDYDLFVHERPFTKHQVIW
jgi:hypothetical protein